MNPILEVRDLNKQFIDKDGHVVKPSDHIDLALYPNETLAVVGESGCGKSTLIKQIIGVLKPDDGQILYDGKNIVDLSAAEKKEIYKDIQMIFQDPNAAFDPRMKIYKIITEPLIHHKKIKRSQAKEVAKEYLKMVGLSESLATRYPHQLSGGQKQRVGIARALTLKPKIILCDEITSALDVSVQKEILDLLEKLKKELGVSFIFITHDLALVEQIADRSVVMKDGKIVETLESKNLKKEAKHPYTRKLLEAVYEPRGAA